MFEPIGELFFKILDFPIWRKVVKHDGDKHSTEITYSLLGKRIKVSPPINIEEWIDEIDVTPEEKRKIKDLYQSVRKEGRS